jgi:hypothetical protein
VANRHALLIGVPHYDDDEFNEPRLADAVRSDLAAMRAALDQSGYAVTECGTVDAERGGATRNRIIGAIKTACANAPDGGVLLIYFSGHGVAVGGQDYLVPADVYRTDGQPDTDSMVPVIPLSSLAACHARLVVFFVDACRDDSSQEQPSAERSLRARDGLGRRAGLPVRRDRQRLHPGPRSGA